MLRISRSVVIGIAANLLFICFYLILVQFKIESYALVLFCSLVSFSYMLFFICITCKSKINLCIVFLALCFLFYYGQFVEFCITGSVENTVLSIIKEFSKKDMVWVAITTLIYIHVLHSGMLFASSLKESNRTYTRFTNYSLDIIRKTALLIYISAYPLSLYYQYSRFKYSTVWGYGRTLYSGLASSSLLLRFGEFLSGFVISMYILLIMAYKGKKFIYVIMVSIVPYIGFYILSGSRLQVALLLIVLLLIRHYWFKKIKSKDILKIIIIGIAFTYIITISFNTRNFLGMNHNIFTAIKNAYADTNLLDSINHMFDEFGCQIVSIASVLLNCPSSVSYNYGKLYLYGIEIIIPNLFGYQRIFFTENTDDAFKYLINGGNTGLGSSFISESFYSFGYFGIVLVFLFGIIIWKVSQRIEISKNMSVLQSFISFYIAYFIIFTVRSDTFNILSSLFQYCLFPIFLMSLINGLISKRKIE